MGPRLVCVLLALALVAPCAQAASASADFVVAGGLSLPEGTTQEMQARAAYLAARELGFEALRIEAKSLRVHRYETTYQEVRLPAANPNVATSEGVFSYTLTDVTVTLAQGDHRGWLSLYFPQAGGPLGATSSGALRVEGQAAARLGEGASRHNEAQGPQPQAEGYDWQAEAPLLLVTMEGELRQRGGGMMKLQGPDLVFAARENTSAWETGNEPRGEGPVGERFSRWFFLEYDEADVTLVTPEPLQVAAASMRVSWSGPASFRAVEGGMTSGGVAYLADGRLARVVGELAGSLDPLPAGAEVRMRLSLSGDLSGTTLLPAEGSSVPLGARPRGWGLVLGGALAVALAALLAAYVVRRRKRGPRTLAPLHVASLPPRAGPRRAAPASLEPPATLAPPAAVGLRALLDEASYLGAMGRVEEALAHYARASELDPEGDADLQAAVLLLQSGGDPARAETLAVKAFARSPILVLEALYDASGTFDPLRGRPAFEDALLAAKQALGEK